MNLPRVIIAGEYKSGFVPPSVLLTAAMKRSGIPLHVFYCGFNPVHVRLLQSVAEENITVINLKTCTNPKIVRTLFETSAKPNKLNIIVCDLGKRGQTTFDCVIDTTAKDIAATLDCSIILCCYAENHPRPVVKILKDICASLESAKDNVRIDGAVFINPFDLHSFQLVENNIGINFRWSTYGYLPSELEPPIPTIEALSSISSYSRETFSIRAIAARIAKMQGQIDYLALEAIGKYNQAWTPTGGIAILQKRTFPKVAIINDIALAGEGNNAELLFKSFGCRVYHVSVNEDIASQNFDMFYFPDGLGYIAIDSFKLEKNFFATIKRASINGKIVFANGASGLIFGDKFIKPDGSEANGLGIFPVTGNYNNSTPFNKPVPVICVCFKADGLLLQGNEKINAYMLPNIGLESNSKNLLCSFADSGNPAGSTGYEENNSILTSVCVDLWSNIEVVRRILNTV